MATSLTIEIIQIIKNIPAGKVLTYGQVAAAAGNNRAARQVARILHSSTKKHALPWHRIVGKNGMISFAPGKGYEVQKKLLEKEGIIFMNAKIDLDIFGWKI